MRSRKECCGTPFLRGLAIVWFDVHFRLTLTSTGRMFRAIGQRTSIIKEGDT